MLKREARLSLGKRVSFDLGPRGAYEGVLEKVEGTPHWAASVRVDAITSLPVAERHLIVEGQLVSIPGVLLGPAHTQSKTAYFAQLTALLERERTLLLNWRNAIRLKKGTNGDDLFAVQFREKALATLESVVRGIGSQAHLHDPPPTHNSQNNGAVQA